jgi:transitional endoplasmic reticulum ATPase
MSKRPTQLVQTNNPFDGLVRLWMLRILVKLKAHKDFLDVMGYENSAIASYLGLQRAEDFCDESLDPSSLEFNFDAKKALAAMRQSHLKAEKNSANYHVQPELTHNIKRLSEVVLLNQVEIDLLQFTVILNTHALLDNVADYLGGMSSTELYRTLTVLLGHSERDVRQALHPNAILAQAGILTVDRSCMLCLRGKLDLISNEFAEKMLSDLHNPLDLLKGTVNKGAAPLLTWHDYTHISKELTVLRPYLTKVLSTKKKGVNILIHGLAGTGKNELSRLLAQTLAVSLFEVASEDDDGDPLAPERRLRAYRAGQTFFANRPALLVFDEAEDVYGSEGNDFFSFRSAAQKRKAWMNRMLEENALPTLWLSNRIDNMDNAFLRRYDMIIELTVPSKEHRAELLQKSVGDIFSAHQIKAFASAEALTPAIVSRAGEVIQLIRDEVPQESLINHFSLLVNGTLTAQGHAKVNTNSLQALPEDYDPSFINTDTPLDNIATQLKQHRQANLCFYGASGTGKTAFGRWLAEQLDCTLLSKKVSDLVSPYVGMTEKNIAKAFEQAQRDNAILLIDECDSFLADRRYAKQNWEVTQVNEMLTQMETFEGIFIASTNLMSNLDPATLRRFDLKIRFDYLNKAQIKTLFVQLSTKLNLGEVTDEQLAQLAQLQNLSLGDFAIIKRQQRLYPCMSNAQLLAVLRHESELKSDGQKQKIGFI